MNKFGMTSCSLVDRHRWVDYGRWTYPNSLQIYDSVVRMFSSLLYLGIDMFWLFDLQRISPYPACYVCGFPFGNWFEGKNRRKWRIWMFPLENPFNQLEQAFRLHPNNWTSRANTLMLLHVSEFRELFIAILEYVDVVDVRDYTIHVWTRGVDVFSCGRLDVIDGLLFWCLFSPSSGHRSFGCCLERAGGCPGGWGDARSGLWAKLWFCEQKMGTEPEGIGYEHVSTIRSGNVNLTLYVLGVVWYTYAHKMTIRSG